MAEEQEEDATIPLVRNPKRRSRRRRLVYQESQRPEHLMAFDAAAEQTLADLELASVNFASFLDAGKRSEIKSSLLE